MTVVRIVLFTLIPVAAVLLGSAVAAWRTPGPRLTALIQHLAAGVVFAAATLELLPQERHGQPLPVVLGFALGVGLMLLVRKIEARFEGGEDDGKGGQPIGLLALTAIDLLIDGLVLGIGFGVGEKAGVLLVIALSLEVLFIGVTLATALKAANGGYLVPVAGPVGIALLLSVGAATGFLALPHLSPFAFTMLLGVGTVAFLYLVTEELLVEAHEQEETPWSVATFFGGFLLFLLIEMWVECQG